MQIDFWFNLLSRSVFLVFISYIYTSDGFVYACSYVHHNTLKHRTAYHISPQHPTQQHNTTRHTTPPNTTADHNCTQNHSRPHPTPNTTVDHTRHPTPQSTAQHTTLQLSIAQHNALQKVFEISIEHN